jgi:hypothetical protein
MDFSFIDIGSVTFVKPERSMRLPVSSSTVPDGFLASMVKAALGADSNAPLRMSTLPVVVIAILGWILSLK